MLQALVRNWWAVVLRGVFAVLFGLAAFAWPGLTLATLVLLFGAYALADGVFALIAALANRTRGRSRWLVAVEGVAGIVAGVLTFAWPAVTAVVLLYFIAGWAIVTGVLEIAAAVRLRRELEGEWLLALSGIASIVFGVLLAAQPAAGALALVWLIGAYAVIFGALGIALGLRLRSLGDRVDRALRRAA